MKTKQLLQTAALALVSSLIPHPSASFAGPLGTAFTYQGRLTDGPNPAKGIYDLRFSIHDALAGNAVAGRSPMPP